MSKLTSIIPTGNEQNNIIEAIQSVRFSDEVMVVDSLSTDDTVKLARPLVDTILEREYVNSASQKNWAIPQAKHEWILLLDADERVTSELQKEVMRMINSNTEYSGFWIRRENYFMGKKVRFSGWQGDKVIRLFRRDECKYENKHVHAEIISSGKIGFLHHKLLHNTFVSKEAYLNKLDRYAKLQAKDYDKKVKYLTPFHTVIKPIVRFLKHYFLQLGILDGYVGFVISSYQAKAVAMRYKYIQEIRKAEKAKYR